jgi:hypothetical protein
MVGANSYAGGRQNPGSHECNEMFSDAEADFPITVVFILSAPHSGSNWLNLVLGSCSWALNLGEYYRPWKWPDQGYCRLCEADGLPECTLLHGIENVEQHNAFHFAAFRSKKRVIVDCSKQLDWCSFFLSDPRISVRIIHLVRHPAGYVESQLRRAPHLRHSEVLNEWEAVNKSISEFTSQNPELSTLACYDFLADDPSKEFPKLCRFIGQSWEPDALRYWEVPHHGLGGNGANSVYLRGRKAVRFATGDDPYYEGIAKRSIAADTRFRDRLPADIRHEAVSRPYARELMSSLGAQWLP